MKQKLTLTLDLTFHSVNRSLNEKDLEYILGGMDNALTHHLDNCGLFEDPRDEEDCYEGSLWYRDPEDPKGSHYDFLYTIDKYIPEVETSFLAPNDPRAPRQLLGEARAKKD